jgi:hypothetical protein
MYCVYCREYVLFPHTCEKKTAMQAAYVKFQSMYRIDQTNARNQMDQDGGRMSGKKKGAE